MCKTLTPSQKTIKTKIAEFETGHLKLLKSLTLNDVLSSISPYLLIVKDTSLASKIVTESINTILNAYQKRFILNLLNGEKTFDTKFIETVGYRIKKHNDIFSEEKSNVINKLTHEFIITFCNDRGAINWTKLVEWNSGNLDLDTFLSPKT